VMNCDQVLTQNLRHYMLHMLRSPTESCAVEVGRSRLQNGDVAYGSKTVLMAPKHDFRFARNNGHRQTGPTGPFRARSGPEGPSSAPMASTEPNSTTVIVLPLFEMTP